MKIKYNSATDDQVRWGSNDDPRDFLVEGREYDLLGLEVHSWHTKVILTDFHKQRFNSVSFDIPEGVLQTAINGWQNNERHKFNEKEYPYIYYPESPL